MWCYTLDGNTRFEHCDQVPYCPRSNCGFKADSDCTTSLGSDKIVANEADKLKVTQTDINGFLKNVCYRCTLGIDPLKVTFDA